MAKQMDKNVHEWTQGGHDMEATTRNFTPGLIGRGAGACNVGGGGAFREEGRATDAQIACRTWNEHSRKRDWGNTIRNAPLNASASSVIMS